MGLPALQYAPTVPGRIHRAGFGWVNVGGHVFEHDRVIHQAGVSSVWWRNRRHTFDLDDALAIVVVHRPKLLIVGCGWMGMLRVDVPQLTAALAAKGVDFQAQRTPDAVLTYQLALQRGCSTVLAMHSTC